jgi:ABC-type Zn uptake system ZnuABC Zn-binding protein ZnuA
MKQNLLAVLLMIGSCLQGCERPSGTAKDPAPMSAVGTIYPLADVIRAVGGKRTDVAWLIETGQSLVSPPGDYVRKLDLADLIVARGADEQWALKGVDDPYRARRYVRLDLLPAARGVQGYVWLDPQVIRELVAVIRERLVNENSEYEEFFKSNESAFLKELDALVTQHQGILSNAPRRPALSLTGDFAPLAKAFQLELIPVLPTSGSALTDDAIRQARKIAAEKGITTLFVPSDRLPAVQRDIAARTGLRVLTLDPLGSSARAGRNTYLQILRYNLEQLEQGTNESQ